MGTIIEFPADAASRRLGSTMDGAPREAMGTLLILPVVRIERGGNFQDIRICRRRAFRSGQHGRL
jgi:hypothetical protein